MADAAGSPCNQNSFWVFHIYNLSALGVSGISGANGGLWLVSGGGAGYKMTSAQQNLSWKAS
jgi:hypothetical protein